MIVDDVESNRLILELMLRDLFDIVLVNSGREALEYMAKAETKPDLLLLDVVMPVMDGYEVLATMRSIPDLSHISVIFVTAEHDESKGLRFGAADYIVKPFDPDVVRLRVSREIELIRHRKNLEGLVNEKTEELLNTKQNFLDAMAELVERRDYALGNHVVRTRELARIILNNMLQHNVYNDELQRINHNMFLRAMPLHDIGKVSIPDKVLLKPSKYEQHEFELMKTHTTIGASIIKSIMHDKKDDYLTYCHDICRHHHEWWNGKGYPDGLAGTNIPISARIATVADVYDALVSDRIYRKGMSHEMALDIIKEGSGTQFDPEIVRVMMMAKDKLIELY